jgi:hypothetical protein
MATTARMKRLHMVAVRQTSARQVEDRALFMPLPRTTLGGRLAREVAEAIREIGESPASYLSAAFTPDRVDDWFPLRLFSGIGNAIGHPIEFIKGTAAADEIGLKRRRKLIPVLAVSAAIHGTLIVYLVYLMFFSQFAGIRVVNKRYKKFDPNEVSGKLYYPAQIIRQHELDNLMKLDEIRERDRKRREELARKQKEKEEREKKQKEEAERKAKEEQAKAEAQKNQPSSTEFGEINEAPIKDIIGSLYALYKAGELDMGPDLNFSMMATFKIEADGSISGMKMIKPSPSKTVDLKALEILHMIGESHALGPLKNLSSGSIKLDLTDNVARLTISAFAPTPEDAKAKAQLLNFLLLGLRVARKNSSPDVAELLSFMKVRSDNNRLDADLTVPRARANEMMRSRFGSNPPQ